ncbi:hypothetical protein F4818DRAFT_437861 [Hypoxylon cercidicola]|nr:hypothetical protein F4818DRAFT_437861 [Hypoxylon cercidicola]
MASSWPIPPPAKLESFPSELINEICKSLDCKDIGSLRQTCRALCPKTSYRFGTFFEYKTIQLTPECLFEFIYQARTSPLARHLKHLTIQGYAYSDRTYKRVKERHRPSQDTYLFPYLVKAFQTLLKYGPAGYGLSSLSLSVIPGLGIMGEVHVPFEFRSYHTIWDVATRTFTMAMKALKQSQMPVYDSLDLFSNVKACSLRYDIFLQFAKKFAGERVEVFKTLKRLTMSLSLESTWEKVSSPRDMVGAELALIRDAIQRRCIRQVLQVIMHGLHFMPQLDDLDFHWYIIPLRDDEDLMGQITNQGPPILHSVPPLTTTSLKTCTLRGLFVSGPDLLHFLKIVRPSTLALESITLTSGYYGPILRYLTSQSCEITSYYLDDLRRAYRMMHFAVPGKPKYDRSRPQVGPSTLKREGAEAKIPVQCEVARGDVVYDEKWLRWDETNRQEYGGVAIQYYNFMKWNKSPIPGDTRRRLGEGLRDYRKKSKR